MSVRIIDAKLAVGMASVSPEGLSRRGEVRDSAVRHRWGDADFSSPLVRYWIVVDRHSTSAGRRPEAHRWQHDPDIVGRYDDRFIDRYVVRCVTDKELALGRPRVRSMRSQAVTKTNTIAAAINTQRVRALTGAVSPDTWDTENSRTGTQGGPGGRRASMGPWIALHLRAVRPVTRQRGTCVPWL